MTRSKWAPFKRLIDWEGQKVRARRDITNNGGATIKAGEECVVEYATVGKLHLKGENAYIRMVSVSDVEAINPPEPEAPIELFRAAWQDGLGIGSLKVAIWSAKFKRGAKSWRLVGDRVGGPWGYKANFDSAEPPGFETPGEAVRALLDNTRGRIEELEKTIEFQRRRLKSVEDYLKGLNS